MYWKHGMFSTKIFRCRRCDRDVANLTGGSDVEDVNSGDEEEVSWSRGQKCDGDMPDLTGNSDSEEVKNGTDQQDQS